MLFRNILDISHESFGAVKQSVASYEEYWADSQNPSWDATALQGGRGWGLRVSVPLGFCACFSSLVWALGAFPHPSHLFALLPCPSGNHPTIQRKTKSGFYSQSEFPVKWPCFSNLDTVLNVALKQVVLDELCLLAAHSLWIGFHSEETGQGESPGRGKCFELGRQPVGKRITEMKTELDYFPNSF